jgi:hypothetical protein
LISPATYLERSSAPTSKRDLAKLQEQFNAWEEETGLPYRHKCAMSIGENYEGDRYGATPSPVRSKGAGAGAIQSSRRRKPASAGRRSEDVSGATVQLNR